MSPTSQLSIEQADFSAGMVRDQAPHRIPDNGVFDLVNFLLRDDSSPYRRGGTTYHSNAAFGSGLRWIWDGYLEPGRRTLFANASDFGVLAADDITPVNLGEAGLAYPKPAKEITGLLFIGGGYIYGGSRKTATYSTGTVATDATAVVTGTGTTWSTNLDAGMLFQAGSTAERVYVIASVDSNTQITLTENYQGAVAGGRPYVTYPIYAINAADPYDDVEFYAVAFNRLITGSGNRLRFSEINAPHDFTNRLGTTNVHTLPEGVRILGIESVGQNVLIFTTGGIWVLQGIALDIVDFEGNPQHRLSLLSRDQILWGGAAGIASWENTLVVPCTNGIYLIDGVGTPVRISRTITPLFDYYVEGPFRSGGATVHADHYLLPMLTTAASEVHDVLACRLDRAAFDRRRRVTFPWSRLQDSGAKMAAYATRVTEDPQDPILLGAEVGSTARIANCDYYFDPDATHKADADGVAHTAAIVTRDYQTGNGTLNRLRSLRTRAELVGAAADSPTLEFAYSDGATQTGEALWNQVTWNNFTWGSTTTATFTNVNCPMPKSDGRDPHRCRINKSLRYVRFRVEARGPFSAAVVRSLELVVAPSLAGRR